LNSYIQLKDQNFSANRISIPAHSRLKIELPSFCLNSSRASPSNSERFVWRKSDPKILYYREILQFAASDPKGASQDEIQSLLWNLQNETHWENYPDHLKTILQQIDPQASTKLPSRLKNTLKDTAADLITSHLPFGSDARDTIELVKGEYYRFEDIRRSIEQLKSNYPLEPSDELLLGKDFVTNLPLNGTERALSGLGLIVGSGSGYRYIQRVVHAPADYAIGFERGLERAGAHAGFRIEQSEAKQALAGTERSLIDRRQVSQIRTYSAEEANRTFDPNYQPPYKPGTKVVEFKSVEGDEWVRVHGPNNQTRPWIVREEAVHGLSPDEIRIKYSLPANPTYISEVHPNPGVTIRMGRVASNFGGSAGARQYEILDQVDPSWFKNMRSL
jgi:hypothetical protein